MFHVYHQLTINYSLELRERSRQRRVENNGGEGCDHSREAGHEAVVRQVPRQFRVHATRMNRIRRDSAGSKPRSEVLRVQDVSQLRPPVCLSVYACIWKRLFRYSRQIISFSWVVWVGKNESVRYILEVLCELFWSQELKRVLCFFHGIRHAAQRNVSSTVHLVFWGEWFVSMNELTSLLIPVPG